MSPPNFHSRKMQSWLTVMTTRAVMPSRAPQAVNTALKNPAGYLGADGTGSHICELAVIEKQQHRKLLTHSAVSNARRRKNALACFRFPL